MHTGTSAWSRQVVEQQLLARQTGRHLVQRGEQKRRLQHEILLSDAVDAQQMTVVLHQQRLVVRLLPKVQFGLLSVTSNENGQTA